VKKNIKVAKEFRSYICRDKVLGILITDEAMM